VIIAREFDEQHTITLTPFNTRVLKADQCYLFVTPFSGAYRYLIRNHGPGTIYMRCDADPSWTDLYSERLPALWPDTEVAVPDGKAGLRMIVGVPYLDPDEVPGTGGDVWWDEPDPKDTVVSVRLICK
jgi:hypothetical protein